MKASEMTFESGRCYKAYDKDEGTVRIFKFKAKGKESNNFNISRGVRINKSSVSIDWTVFYIGDNFNIEEINESLIDKVMKQFNMDRTAILATINGKRDE